MQRWLTRPAVAATIAAAVALMVLILQPVAALGRVIVPRPPVVATATGSNTQLTLSATGPGHSVDGLLANLNNPYDSATQPYPTRDPVTGFTPQNESFAGVILATPTGGGPDLQMYCIDIRTDTYIGFGYQLGTWNAASVPNVGLVARLLQEYYPNTNEPAALTRPADKAAAVQAAIWYFSDRYVLSTSDPLHDAVAAIVAAVQAAGPLVEPPPPSLVISPSALSGPAGSVIGPYTVTSSLAAATVTAIGADMFSDAAATRPVADGSTVPSGTQLWLRSTGPAAAVLQATANATVPTGNVYLYDGNSLPAEAQKLILAQTSTLTTTVSATAEFLAPGKLLVVDKEIGGPLAGQQGQVTIRTVCDGTPLSPDLIIPAGSPAGTYSQNYTNIPANSVCTVTETADGHTSTVIVTVTGDGQGVSIPSGGTATALVTDTYRAAPGSLLVDKLTAGPAAGQQGPVTIHTVCDGTPLSPDFTIPGGSPAGSYPYTYAGIPAGSACTVTETADGSTSAVIAAVVGSGQAVTVPAGGEATADLTDTYGFAPGSLVVDKVIAGPASGLQGQVTIHSVCDGTPLSPDLIIPAGSPAGTYSHTYPGIPGTALCTVTETADGNTAAGVTTAKTGDAQVTVPPGGTVTARLTDTYDQVPGSLVINKEITGAAAAQQGQVTIRTVCGGTPLSPDFTIPAGSPAGNYSRTYTGIPALSTCTVTETVDGSTSTVTVTVAGSGQAVTVPNGGGATADLSDSYALAPGSLTVSKTIAGPAAGQEGQVVIHTICDRVPLSPDLVIPAGSAAGTSTHTYPGVPGGADCIVDETADGHTSTVTVKVAGDGQHATIPPDGTDTATLIDRYDLVPGSLVVSKTISGPAAGHQGQVAITVSCTLNGASSFNGQVTIPAGTPAGTSEHGFAGIPAGSGCTVTETQDGRTATVTAVVTGNGQQVTVASGQTVPAGLVDMYDYAPGSLTVPKAISGAGAGKQGRIAILAACGGAVHVFGFLIPAGAAAGTVKRSFDGIPAGSRCTVIEVANGADNSVSVTVAGSGRRATVPPAGAATLGVADVYTPFIPVTG